MPKYTKRLVWAGALILLTVYFLIVFEREITLSADTQLAEKQFKDGVYEGRSFKFPGQMKVLVVMKDNKMADIKILRHLALKKYTNMLEPLMKNIIKQQSTQVDAVSGATISSNALKKAVDNAVGKAYIEK